MAITALTTISGEILSQPLNDNFSYLNERKNDVEINIKDYGAVGNGITDDSVAVQAAIDSLPNGGIIFCPGKFLVGGGIVDTEHITFVGRSKYDQIIAKNGTTGMTISQNNVNFENITVISQGTKVDGLGTNGILYEKTPTNSIGFAKLENVNFSGFSGYGLKVINAIHFTYDFGYVASCVDGIVFDRDVGALSFGTTVTMKRVYLTSCTKGINASRLYRSSFENVIAEYCTYGMYMNICAFTLYRSYFEANTTKGCYAVDCEIQDLFNYSNNVVTDAIQVAFTGATASADRGYVSDNKFATLAKTVGVLSNYGVDPKYFSAYGNSYNVGLKYGDAIVPIIRGDNLVDDAAWASNRTTEFQGYNQTYQGYKVQGTTAGDNTYGIKQTITLDNTKQYIIDVASTTVLGSGITLIKCGTLTVTNGVPFTPPADGANVVKAYGLDTGGTPFECYVNSFSISEVLAQEKYTAIAQGKLTSKQAGRSTIYASAVATSGTWAVGEIIYSLYPTAGGTIGWVCVTQGTPGTWKTFGTIST